MRPLPLSRLPIVIAAVAIAALWLAPAAAQAELRLPPRRGGIQGHRDRRRRALDQQTAGSHPSSLVTEVNFNLDGKFTEGDLSDLTLDLPRG